MKSVLLLLVILGLPKLSESQKLPPKHVLIDGERWTVIQIWKVENLEKGKIESEDVSKLGMLYPKKNHRCPKGYLFDSMSTTTFVYEQCVKKKVFKDKGFSE